MAEYFQGSFQELHLLPSIAKDGADYVIKATYAFIYNQNDVDYAALVARTGKEGIGFVIKEVYAFIHSQKSMDSADLVRMVGEVGMEGMAFVIKATYAFLYSEQQQQHSIDYSPVLVIKDACGPVVVLSAAVVATHLTLLILLMRGWKKNRRSRELLDCDSIPFTGQEFAHRMNLPFLVEDDNSKNRVGVFRINISSRKTAGAPESLLTARQAVTDIGLGYALGEKACYHGTEFHTRVIKNFLGSNKKLERFRTKLMRPALNEALNQEIASFPPDGGSSSGGSSSGGSSSGSSSGAAINDVFGFSRRVVLRMMIRVFFGPIVLDQMSNQEQAQMLNDIMKFEDRLQDATTKVVKVYEWLSLPLSFWLAQSTRLGLQDRFERLFQHAFAWQQERDANKNKQKDKHDHPLLGPWLHEFYKEKKSPVEAAELALAFLELLQRRIIPKVTPSSSGGTWFLLDFLKQDPVRAQNNLNDLDECLSAIESTTMETLDNESVFGPPSKAPPTTKGKSKRTRSHRAIKKEPTSPDAMSFYSAIESDSDELIIHSKRNRGRLQPRHHRSALKAPSTPVIQNTVQTNDKKKKKKKNDVPTILSPMSSSRIRRNTTVILEDKAVESEISTPTSEDTAVVTKRGGLLHVSAAPIVPEDVLSTVSTTTGSVDSDSVSGSASTVVASNKKSIHVGEMSPPSSKIGTGILMTPRKNASRSGYNSPPDLLSSPSSVERESDDSPVQTRVRGKARKGARADGNNQKDNIVESMISSIALSNNRTAETPATKTVPRTKPSPAYNKLYSVVDDETEDSEEVEEEEEYHEDGSMFVTLGASHGGLILDKARREALRGFLPPLVADQNFWLRYRMHTHGSSLTAMLHQLRASRHTLICIQTEEGHVFGSFTSATWAINRSWYGTGEAFLFRFGDKGEKRNMMEVFPYTGSDDMIQYCSSTILAVGGGDWNNSHPNKYDDSDIYFEFDEVTDEDDDEDDDDEDEDDEEENEDGYTDEYDADMNDNPAHDGWPEDFDLHALMQKGYYEGSQVVKGCSAYMAVALKTWQLEGKNLEQFLGFADNPVKNLAGGLCGCTPPVAPVLSMTSHGESYASPDSSRRSDYHPRYQSQPKAKIAQKKKQKQQQQQKAQQKRPQQKRHQAPMLQGKCPSNQPSGIGLVVDSNLESGETNSCATFSNPCLLSSSSETPTTNEFRIANLEVWTFTPCTSEESAEQLALHKLFVEQHRQL